MDKGGERSKIFPWTSGVKCARAIQVAEPGPHLPRYMTGQHFQESLSRFGRLMFFALCNLLGRFTRSSQILEIDIIVDFLKSS